MFILRGYIIAGLKGVRLAGFGEPQGRYMLLEILGVHLGLLMPHLGCTCTVGDVGFLW